MRKITQFDRANNNTYVGTAYARYPPRRLVLEASMIDSYTLIALAAIEGYCGDDSAD